MMSKTFEFNALPLTFYFFTIFGVWCPSDWKFISKIAYRCYMLSHEVSALLFWSTMFINIVVTERENEFLYENTFAFGTLTFGLYKEVYVLSHREQIIDIIKSCFEDDWYKPIDVDESNIISKYNYETRFGEKYNYYYCQVIFK
jgi:hypothetical protein